MLTQTILLCLSASALGATSWEGDEEGPSYAAYLSPNQEPEEESDTPAKAPEVFRSTEPSLTRAERVEAGHRGYGTLTFSKDLSRAWVRVEIETIDPAKIALFHIHCGLPGVLGPILVDFSLITNITQNFQEDGVFEVEVTNEAIVATRDHGEGMMAELANGCVIPSLSLSQLTADTPKGKLPPKVSTVAGMAEIAEKRHLYFNLHTRAQTFFGDVRGQIWPMLDDDREILSAIPRDEDGDGAEDSLVDSVVDFFEMLGQKAKKALGKGP